MNNAIERLVAELMNLSTDAWAQLAELRRASPNQDAAFEREPEGNPLDGDSSVQTTAEGGA